VAEVKKVYLAIILVGAGLRAFDLLAAPAWYDEVFSMLMMRLPVLDMVRGTAGDTHPPLYYLAGGWDLASARIISVICSTLAMVLLWRLAQLLNLPDRAGMIAVGIMAVVPTQIQYAQEARMYALLQALVLWMWITVLERRWMRSSLIGALMLYTHNYAVFYLPVIWLAALMMELKRPVIPSSGRFEDAAQIKELAISVACTIGAYIPWAVVVIHQAAIIRGVYWIQPVTFGALLYSVYMLFWGFAIPVAIQMLTIMVTFGILPVAIYMAIRDKLRLIVWWALAPIILVAVICLVQPVLLFRGLIGIAPAMYLLVGHMVTRIRTRYVWLVAILAVPLVISGLVSYYQYNPTNKGDWSKYIDVVRSDHIPREPIIHTSVDTLVIWSYLAPDLDNRLLEMDCQRSFGSLSQDTMRSLGMVTSPAVPGAWYVSSLGPMSTRCEEMVTSELTMLLDPVITIRDDKLITQVIYHED
jgi:hypothetical protein